MRPLPFTGCTVLVIEDDPDAREVLQRLLMILGARVMAAADGGEGLERLARSHPDIVFCDLSMPIMDGFEFARRMRAEPQYRRVVLVAVTGRDRQSAFLDTWTAGFHAHLAKPITVEALTALARRLSGRSDVESVA